MCFLYLYTSVVRASCSVVQLPRNLLHSRITPEDSESDTDEAYASNHAAVTSKLVGKGYSVTSNVCTPTKAEPDGVPQERNRLLYFGIHKGRFALVTGQDEGSAERYLEERLADSDITLARLSQAASTRPLESYLFADSALPAQSEKFCRESRLDHA
jgi:site-specific DNA-cytosine methylase